MTTPLATVWLASHVSREYLILYLWSHQLLSSCGDEVWCVMLTLKLYLYSVRFIQHANWLAVRDHLVQKLLYTHRLTHPLPSNRHHQSNGDCLEGKRENYQVCSVQYCVQQLCTVQCTHVNRPSSSLDWVLSHWAHFAVLRFIFVYVWLHACVGL